MFWILSTLRSGSDPAILFHTQIVIPIEFANPKCNSRPVPIRVGHTLFDHKMSKAQMNSTQLIGPEHCVAHLTTNHFFQVHYSTRIHMAHPHEQHEYNTCVCSVDFSAESVGLLVVMEITI